MATRKPRKLEKAQSHKPHGKMGNPNPPQTEEFEQHKIKAFGDVDEPLGKKVWGIKLPLDVEVFLEGMEQRDRVILMRETLVNAARERMAKGNENPA